MRLLLFLRDPGAGKVPYAVWAMATAPSFRPSFTTDIEVLRAAAALFEGWVGPFGMECGRAPAGRFRLAFMGPTRKGKDGYLRPTVGKLNKNTH